MASKCPVCFQDYSEIGEHLPRILPCKCTLCESCIRKLIKNDTLICPKDSRRFFAASGVKTFRENTDILGKGDVCATHALQKSLYCRNVACKKAVCPMCVGKLHASHEIVDILEQKKNELETIISVSVNKLSTYSNNIRKAKQQSQAKAEELIKEIRAKLTHLHQEMDSKIIDNNNMVAKLGEIRKEIPEAILEKISEKEEYVFKQKALIEEIPHQVSYRFCELNAQEFVVDPQVKLKPSDPSNTMPGSAESTNRKMPTSFYDQCQLQTRFRSKDTVVTMLPNGDVACCGKERLNFMAPAILAVYSLGNGQALGRREVGKWAGGLASVKLNEQDCLALSFEHVTVDGTHGGIEFLSLQHNYSSLYTFKSEQDTPTVLASSQPSTLLYFDSSVNGIKHLDCSKYPPEVTSYTSLVKDPTLFECRFPQLADLYIVEQEQKIILLYPATIGNIVVCQDGLTKEPLLKLKFSPLAMAQISSVSTDGQKYIFCCDTHNKSVHLFSVGGEYLGVMLKKGDLGIGEPHLVRWCNERNALVVGHTNSSTDCYTVSFIQISKQTVVL